MRLEPGKLDKFASIYKAGAHRPKKPRPIKTAPSRQETPDAADDVAPGVRLYKTARERQIEAIDDADRHWKLYKASRQRRLDRLTQEVPGAAKFLRALIKAEPTARSIAYRDIDLDLAGLARRLSLADVQGDYDRFTLYEEAVSLVDRVARRSRRHTEPDATEFFCEAGSLTTLDELKLELRLK